MQWHIRKARVIDPQSHFHDQVVDLLIEDGTIKEIAASKAASFSISIDKKVVADNTSAGDGAVYISPGWVDTLADYREPGFEQKETITSGLAAAASGGFTDVLLAPNTQPSLSSKSVIQFVLQKAAGHVVNIHPVCAVTQQTEGKDLAEMLDMRSNGAIAFSDGWKPVQSANLMLKALEYIKAFHGTLLQIPVDTALSSGGLMNEGIVSTSLGMAGIPALAETLMVYRDIELVRYSGSKLHISGISCAASVDMVRKAKAAGLTITCSVTPYHLALTDESLTTYDSIYKVSPPLRTEADRQALIAGLADGTIDCVASHHRPQEWDAKAKEFEYAADGMAVQESTFNILWDTLHRHMSIDRIIEAMTIIPRDIFGMKPQEIKKGGTTSLTIFSTAGHHTLLNENAQSASRNNPFIGKQLRGSVIGIINNGQIHLNK